MVKSLAAKKIQSNNHQRGEKTQQKKQAHKKLIKAVHVYMYLFYTEAATWDWMKPKASDYKLLQYMY